MRPDLRAIVEEELLMDRPSYWVELVSSLMSAGVSRTVGR